MSSDPPPDSSATPDRESASDGDAHSESMGASFTGPVSGDEPPRLTRGTKILLGLMGASMLLSFLCCGGYFWMVSRLKAGLIESPEQIIDLQQEVMPLDLGDDWEPLRGQIIEDFPLDLMPDSETVVFRKKGDDENLATLALGRIDLPEGQEAEIAERVRGVMAQKTPSGATQELKDVEELRTETITIGAEEVLFEFVEGTDSKSQRRVLQVSGVWTEGDRVRVFVLREPADSVDDAKIDALLRSIR